MATLVAGRRLGSAPVPWTSPSWVAVRSRREPARPGARGAVVSEPESAGASPPGEAALIARVQRGDVAAFDALVRAHERRAFAVAYRVMGQRQDAEDLVQESFMAALERIDGFDTTRPFAPWLLRIVVNKGLNARRARALRTTDAMPDEVIGHAPSQHEELEETELRQRLRDAIAQLPERQRLVIQLFELDGLSAGEVAEILDISPGTVRWHAHEARAALRRTLAGYHGGTT